ncbi:MAG: ABC transporter substrate-binding protein [Candidatus Dojkabacteria bacterium]
MRESKTKKQPGIPSLKPGKIIFFVLPVLYVALTLLTISNFDVVTAIQEEKKGNNTIVEGLLFPSTSASPEELFYVDPLLSDTNDEYTRELRTNLSFLLFSSLFKENTGNSLDNDLVKEYSFEDATTFKATLRDDVVWHDGSRLTADDVIFTLNVINAIGQDGFYFGAVNGSEIEYNAPSDYEVYIKLKTADDKGEPKPNAAYLYELTFPVLPKHVLERYRPASLKKLPFTEFGKNPLGSGILKFSTNRRIEMVFERNQDYYKDQVHFDEYIFRFYKDYDALIKDAQLKNVHIITRKDVVGSDDLHENLNTIGMNNYKMTIKNKRLVLYFNLDYKGEENSPFSQFPYLRSSLQKVINRENITQNLGGNCREIYGPIDHTSWAFSNDFLQSQQYNEEEFKKNLKELSYEMKDGYYQNQQGRLSFTLTYLSGDVRDVVARTLQQDLKTVGVEVKLQEVSSSAPKPTAKNAQQVEEYEDYTSIISNRNFEALLSTSTQYQEPDRFSEWHSSRIEPPGLNISGFDNKIIDLTLVEGRVSTSVKERKAKYERFQKTFAEYAPAIYLLNPGMTVYYSDQLEDIEQIQIIDTHYRYEDIANWKFKT